MRQTDIAKRDFQVGFFVGGFGLALSGSVGLWCWCI